MSALIKELEALFANSEQRVLAAFVAVKCDPAASSTRGRRTLPKSTGKARVICLTAKRRSKKRGFKGTLHVCKLSQGRYQVRKSVKLKTLTRVEAFVDSPGQQEYFELTLVQRGFTSGESRLAFEVKDALVRLELLGTLYSFCRAHEKRAPQLVGIDAAELESSAALYSKQAAERNAGPDARVLLKEGVREEAAGAAAAAAEDGAHPLWGQREDKQIQSLLEMVSVGAASMGELQQRLETELAALEDASVHEILENGGMVQRVLEELASTLFLLDDLEENINVFDARLRHMREDIAAIEGRNNQLELHSRNNEKLLTALEGLMERLTLPEGAERALQARDITSSNLAQVVEAGWELHARLQALSEQADGGGGAAADGGGGAGDENRLPRSLANMAAVSAQRQRLHALQRAFLDKAGAFLQEQLGHIADAALQRVNALQGAQRVGPVEHASLRRRAAELAPLLEVVGALRPAATVAPREAYCQALNTLLRREVHVAASELRRMAAAADAGGQQEPDLLGRATAAESASTLERLSTVPQGSAHSRMPSMASMDLTASYREAGITPIHEGYEALLDSHIPLLAEEAQQCIALMFPKALQAASAGGGAGGAAGAASGMGGAGSKSVRFAGSEAREAGQLLDAGGADVQGVVASLLAGVEAELMGLVEAVKQQRALLCLPMLGATLAWRQRLAARGPGCRPLAALLGQCERRLIAMLSSYFSERAAAIQRYDGRSSMSVGGGTVKTQHVLPFIANFPAVAGRIEELLSRWPAEQAQQAQQQLAQQQRTPVSPAVAASAAAAAAGRAPAGGSGRPPLPPAAGSRTQQQPQQLFPSPFESSLGNHATPPAGQRGALETIDSELSSVDQTATEATEISFMESDADSGSRRVTTDASAEGEALDPRGAAAVAAAGAGTAAQPRAPVGGLPPAAQQPAAGQQQEQQREPGPGEVLRELVDGGYDAWLRAMAAAVEALGTSDAKHGMRLRLENYAFWNLGLQSLPLGHAPALAAFGGQVAALRDRAMGGYIEQQVDYFKFTRILEFSRKLDEVMDSVGAADVHLQLQFQPAEVRQLLAATTSGLDKKLAQVYQRILKHLAATSPYLVDPVWHKLESICLQRWGRMEDQLRQCYKGVELRPPLEELRRMFATAKRAQ